VPDFKLAILIAGTAIGSPIFVAVPLVVSELTPQSQRAAMLAIVNSIMTLGGVIAPFAMGVVVQDGATRLAGYDNGFTILGGLLLASGLIGLLFIRPEADRRKLAARAALRPMPGAP
jgi:MFS family permease